MVREQKNKKTIVMRDIFGVGWMDVIAKYLDEFDGMALFRVGPFYKFLAVADHELIELICTGKHVEKSGLYKIFERRLGRGLFTLEGEAWKKARKQALPLFYSNTLENIVGTINSIADTFVANLKKNSDDGPTEIYGPFYAFSADVIVGTSVGMSLDEQATQKSEFIRSSHESQALLQIRLNSVLMLYDWFYFFTRSYWKERKVLPILKNNTRSVMKRRIEALARQDDVRPAQMDYLFTIRGKGISDGDLGNLIEGMTFAGHDTTASAMAFTVYLLSQDLEVQRKTFEEQRFIFGDDRERDCTSKDLQEMTYLEMVIKESLRLYTPVPLIAKQLTEDIEFKGRTLPKGLMLFVLPQVIQRRAKYFPDPGRFDPERFSPENQAGIAPFSYLPFSAGRRNCIGQKYAMMEMKIALSKVLRRYELLPVDGFEMRIIRRVIQRPNRKGVQVRLRERIY